MRSGRCAALETSALDLGTSGRDNYYGYGLVQLRSAMQFNAASALPTVTAAATVAAPGYVLARSQQAPLGSLRALAERQGEARSGLPLAHLAVALQLMGDQPRAEAGDLAGDQRVVGHQFAIGAARRIGLPVRRLQARDAAALLIDQDGGFGIADGGAQFVTPLSLAALSENQVHTSLWDLKDEVEMGHIQLSREADLVVIAPATADLMAKMAAGIADDLATTLLLATDKPVLAAPAMNVRMWQHPATRRNVARVRRRSTRDVDGSPRDGNAPARGGSTR